MKKLLLIILISLYSSAASSKDWATAQIFACEPEWGSLAREIVGNKAKVVVAFNEFQNPHFAKDKPELTADLRKADILFCSGANLESSWLPELLKRSTKPETQIGGVGYFMASEYIDKLDVADAGTKPSLNIHYLGNPHIHLNPNNIPPIAAEFLKRMIAIDPANSKFYQNNYDQFIAKWNLAIVKWELKAQSLKNMPIIVNHDYWAYLADWLHLKIVANLEEKDGAAPKNKYLFAVLKQVRQNPAELVIYTPFEDNSAIVWLSDRAKIRAIVLPFTVSSVVSPTADLFGLFDEILNTLIRQSAINQHLQAINANS